jgi:hypothetical protein
VHHGRWPGLFLDKFASETTYVNVDKRESETLGTGTGRAQGRAASVDIEVNEL